MQTLQQIRAMLEAAGLAPQKQFGQCFLYDQNLLRKVVELADVRAGSTVLEVGPGTGSLTEELLDRAGRVVAVEIDHGLAELLRVHLGGRANFTLIESDVLAGKHAIAPVVLETLANPAAQGVAATEGRETDSGASPEPGATPSRAQLVSNLPYSIATSLIVECLLSSWRARRRHVHVSALAQPLPAPTEPPGVDVLFESLTFTVQREVADRLLAGPGSKDYGPVSVLVALLGRTTAGAILPGSAFWPPPTVASRMARIDFDAGLADRLGDAATLMDLLGLAFGQRRKQIGSLLRRKELRWDAGLLAAAMDQAGVDRSARPETVAVGQYLAVANALAEGARGGAQAR